MNIKSELKKNQNKFLPFITLPTILFALITAVVLSILAFLAGQVLWLKLFFIMLSIIGVMVYTYDNNRDKKGKAYTLKQGWTYIILVLIFLELPLYLIANQEQTIPITVISKIKTKDGEKVDPNCESNCKYKKIKYLKISIYNRKNNEELGYRIFDSLDDPRSTIYKDISSKHSYFNYIPFLVFEEKFNYIYKDKLND